VARMVVIYRNPKDPEAFDHHFDQVHAPLVRALPGLRKMELSRGPVVSPRGEPIAHLVVTLHFDSVAAMRDAFASPEGKAAVADPLDVAPEDRTILQFEDREA
jgi:uncharacterized protein (TIGR02118 family)